MRRVAHNSGFAMMMVMLLLAMAVILGVSYMSMAALKVNSSENYVIASRAKYLAESGVEHAMWVVANNPGSLAGTSAASSLGPFYIDGGSDSYTFYGAADPLVPGRYIVTAKGSSGGLVQVSQAAILRSGAAQYGLSKSVMAKSASAWLPTGLTVNGDFYIEGALTNFAHINGKASATGAIWDGYHYVTGGTSAGAAQQAQPAIDGHDYNSYSFLSAARTAAIMNDLTFAGTNALANGGAVTANNPGGVVKLTRNVVTLPDNFTFTGTLVTDGDIVISGRNIKLTAVDGFPAIITKGQVIVKPSATATINGLVQADAGFKASTSGSAGSSTTVTGGVISSQTGGYDYFLGGTHVLNYDSKRCQLYDFHGGSANGSSYKATLENILK